MSEASMTRDMADMLAMDWALGTLDPAAQAAAEARRQSDPAFAALCMDWAGRLAPLADEVEPVQPSPDLWSNIDAAIGADSIVATPAPAAAPAPWWRSVGLWQGLTGVMAALALTLLVTRPPAVTPPVASPQPVSAAILSTTLSSEAGAPLATAALDVGRSAVVLSPVASENLDGRVPQLWLIPADGTPRSLGLINLGGAQQVQVSPTILKLVAEGAVLAVSLEPVGGSPTGLPTGPVVATGKLTTL